MSPVSGASRDFVSPFVGATPTQRGVSVAIRRIAVLAGVALSMMLTIPFAVAESVDDGYAPLLDGEVYAIAAQPDGYAWVGGSFASVDGTSCPHLCRLGPDGAIASGFERPAVNAPVRAMLIQPDGKVVVGGEFTQVFGELRVGVARLFASGTLDFASGATTNGNVLALALQADGRLLIGGTFSRIGDVWNSRGVARRLANGDADTSFQVDVNGAVFAVAPLLDGRIVIGGAFSQVNGTARQNLAVLAPNGQLAPGAVFNANGAVRSLTRDLDGTLVIGGDFTTIGGIALARLARMTPEATFVYGLADAEASVRVVHVQSDSQLIVGGDFLAIDDQARARLARLDADRMLDPIWRATTNARVSAIAEQPDGSLLVGGSFVQANGETRQRLARVTPQGQLERTLVADAEAGRSVFAVAEQADRGLLLGGSFTTIAGEPRERIARIAPDGRLDVDFVPTANGIVRALAALSDGAVLIAGGFTTVNGNPRAGLAKLDATGSLSSGFATPAFSGALLGMHVAQGDRVYVAGAFDASGAIPSAGVARLRVVDGTVDSDFIANVQPSAFRVTELPDGGVLVVGGDIVDGVSVPSRLVRLRPDGSLDPAFVAELPAGTTVNVAVPLPDGQVLVALDQENSSTDVLRRLRSDGSLDTGFIAVANGAIVSIALRADGRIAIAGQFTTVAGVPRQRVAVLSQSGSLFGAALPEVDSSVLGAHYQQDGKLLLYGAFANVGGAPRRGIARLSTFDAALYSLESDGRALRWLRAGAAPELTTIPRLWVANQGEELQPNQRFRRVAGGWQIDELTLEGAPTLVRLQPREPIAAGNGTGLLEREYLRFNQAVFRNGFEPLSPN